MLGKIIVWPKVDFFLIRFGLGGRSVRIVITIGQAQCRALPRFK